MKKKLLLLCCTAALVLSACGGASSNGSTASNNTEQTVATEENSEEENDQEANSNSKKTEADQTETSDNSEDKWILQQEVDEFGDVKKDGSLIALYEINGTFSNTATNGSELGGSVGFDASRQAFYFSLHEYNNYTNATYISSDSIILKYKAGDDDTIKSHFLGGKAPNTAPILNDLIQQELNEIHEVLSVDSGFYDLAKNLWDGKEVRCIIEIGNSSYNFNIEPSNFQDVCKSQGLSFEDLPKEEAIPLALQVYLEGEEYKSELGNPMVTAYKLLLNNLGTDDLVPESEYKDLMVGHWAYYKLLSTGLAYCIENYDDGTWTDGGMIYPDSHDHEDDDEPKEWSVEDGLIHQLYGKYKMFYTGCEGYYVLYDTTGTTTGFLLVKLDDNCKPMYQPVYK